MGKLCPDQCTVAYVPPLQEDQVITQFIDFLFALTFAQAAFSGFQPNRLSHFLFFHSPFVQIAFSSFQPTSFFSFSFWKPRKGNYIILQPLQTWCFQITTLNMVLLQLIHVGWLSKRIYPRVYFLDNIQAYPILLEFLVCILNRGPDLFQH